MNCYEAESFGRDEARKIPETVCAFANSSGGRIVCEGFDPADLLPSGVPCVRESPFSVYIPPLEWHKKPVILNGRVYRRVEGENLISGLRAKSIMAEDSNEPSRDDWPCEAALNYADTGSFLARISGLNRNMSRCTKTELLRRCGVYSGKYLTFAGALMLGEIVRISARLDYSGGHSEIEALNIWSACTRILPRLTSVLSEKCADAFRELFINALLHADYNADRRINIAITSPPLTVTADNPGTIRGAIRNHRLAKMFALSGITGGRPHGLDIIRSYMPNFTLKQDMLTLRTTALLRLEGRRELPDPVIL